MPKFPSARPGILVKPSSGGRKPWKKQGEERAFINPSRAFCLMTDLLLKFSVLRQEFLNELQFESLILSCTSSVHFVGTIWAICLGFCIFGRSIVLGLARLKSFLPKHEKRSAQALNQENTRTIGMSANFNKNSPKGWPSRNRKNGLMFLSLNEQSVLLFLLILCLSGQRKRKPLKTHFCSVSVFLKNKCPNIRKRISTKLAANCQQNPNPKHDLVVNKKSLKPLYYVIIEIG